MTISAIEAQGYEVREVDATVPFRNEIELEIEV